MNPIPVKPADTRWTDNQWKSIYAKGQDILILCGRIWKDCSVSRTYHTANIK